MDDELEQTLAVLRLVSGDRLEKPLNIDVYALEAALEAVRAAGTRIIGTVKPSAGNKEFLRLVGRIILDSHSINLRLDEI